MIKITRAATPVILDLSKSESAATKELRLAKAYHGAPKTSDQKPNFKVYSDQTVRRALKEAFKFKCAYCEGSGAGFDCDIEHYRPKGSVAEEKNSERGHPGYWWLAMDWTNLTLSCQHCNQRRKQIMYFPGMTEKKAQEAYELNRRTTVGKLDSFPVQAGTRAFTPEETSNEKPLLINPLDIDPEEHLDWDFKEDLPMPVPKDQSKLGEASIIAYALWRSNLADDRRLLFQDLKKMRDDVERCVIDLVNETEELKVVQLTTKMETILGEMLRYCGPHRKYAGMARAYFKLVRDEFTG